MVPPVDTVLRRRHIALIVLRAAAVAMLVYGAAGELFSFPNLFASIRNGPVGLGTLVDFVGPRLRFMLPGLLLAVVSRRLATWIVPGGLRSDACSNCGYSLRNLKSPICPECGADVGPRRRVS